LLALKAPAAEKKRKQVSGSQQASVAGLLV
jgi:hypothetical protein